MALPCRLPILYAATTLGCIAISTQQSVKLLRWRDGRAFKRRVQVLGANCRHLFYAHAELALALCHSETACIDVDCHSGTIDRIVILRVAGDPDTDPTILNAANYSPRRHIYPEKLGDMADWQGYWTWAFARPRKAIPI